LFVMVWLTKFVLLISWDSAMGSYNLKIEQQPSRKRSGHVTLVTCTLCSCMYKCIIDQTALLHVRQGSCHSNSALAALCLHSCACSQRSLNSPSSHFLVSAISGVLKESALLYMSSKIDRQESARDHEQTVRCTHCGHSTCTQTSHSIS